MTAPNEHLLASDTIDRLRQWYDRISRAEEGEFAKIKTSNTELPEGWIEVYDVGSVVAYRDTKDVLRDIMITGHQLMQMGDGLHLVYTYEGRGFTASIPGDRVTAVGDDWSTVYWNPETGERRESFDDEMAAEENVVVDLGPSPYIVGSPVDREEMFFGREGIMGQIRRQVGANEHGNVILLEGNRRSGKTSILRQLEKEGALPGWAAVYCSFQDVDSVATHDVFRLLARETAWALANYGIETWIPGVPRLESGKPFKHGFLSALDEAFSDDHPFETLEMYLSSAVEAARPRRVLLMLDEFDKLQEGIDSGITSPQVPENIRHLLQHQLGVGAIITGSRRLKRLREEYWSALFGIGYRIGVSSLSKEDARRLVIEPVAGRLEYEASARDRVLEMCACHPFLIQSRCSRVFDQAATGSVRTISLDVVERASTEMVRDNEHFRTLWDYAGSERRRLILALGSWLANGGSTVDLTVIGAKLNEIGISDFGDQDLVDDLDELRELELIEFDDTDRGGTYRLAVPLMAMWLEMNVTFDDLMVRARREAESSW